MLSLHEFGEQTGCDYTTASRLLSGDRAPSTALLERICGAYGLDANEALAALAEDRRRPGPVRKTVSFAAFLRDKVFDQDVTKVTSVSTLSGGQQGITMVEEAGATRPDETGS